MTDILIRLWIWDKYISMLTFFPELDFEFKKYWDSQGSITTNPPNTSEISRYVKTKSSVFSLLFDNYFMDDSFTYTFSMVSKTILPNSVSQRLSVTHHSLQIFQSDDAGINILNLEEVDIQLLGQLFNYRNGVHVNLTPFNFDLLSKLSKLIYIYLDTHINLNFERFKTTDPLITSTDSIYLKLFELYVTNEAFKVIRTTEEVLNVGEYRYIPIRQKLKVDSSILTDGFVVLNKVPNMDMVSYFVLNGDVVKKEDYQISLSDDHTVYGVVWDSNQVSLKLNDIIIIDYYTRK